MELSISIPQTLPDPARIPATLETSGKTTVCPVCGVLSKPLELRPVLESVTTLACAASITKRLRHTMRAIAREKLGDYPLAPREAERIRGLRVFVPVRESVTILDSCAGSGAELATIIAGSKALRYGVELDAYRA